VNAPQSSPMMMYSGDQSPTVMFSGDQSPGGRDEVSDHPFAFNFSNHPASPKAFPQSPVMGAPVPALTMSPMHSPLPMQHHLYMQQMALNSPHYGSPVHGGQRETLGGGPMSQPQMLPPMQLQPGVNQFYQPAPYSGYGAPLNYRAKPFTLNRSPGQ